MIPKAYRPFLGLAACMLISSSARATAFFDWPDFETTASGSFSTSLLGIGVDVDVTVQQGSFHTGPMNATDPTFLGLFPAVVPVAFYQATSGFGGASIASTFSFSSVLPTGSRLLAIDLDGANEQMTISSAGSHPPLLFQLESMTGAASTFPTYNPATGELTKTITSGNDYEVSVFDVSGFDSLDVGYAGGSFNGGSFLALSLPGGAGNAVPEPATILLDLVALGAGLTLTSRGRKRG